LFIRLREGQHSFLRSYQLSMRKGSAAAEALLLMKRYKVRRAHFEKFLSVVLT
jgi:hypothetical protein